MTELEKFSFIKDYLQVNKPENVSVLNNGAISIVDKNANIEYRVCEKDNAIEVDYSHHNFNINLIVDVDMDGVSDRINYVLDSNISFT